MLRLLGIRAHPMLIAVAGIVLLVIGLVAHGPGLMAFGGLAIVWAAVTLAAARRRAWQPAATPRPRDCWLTPPSGAPRPWRPR